MLKNLNEVYPVGRTEIWYQKPYFFRDGGMGYDWLKEYGMLPDPLALSKTHVMVGRLAESSDLDRIYYMMQGEIWSPEGEANELIRALELHHTSMSIGDIVVKETLSLLNRLVGTVYIVDRDGFAELGETYR